MSRPGGMPGIGQVDKTPHFNGVNAELPDAYYNAHDPQYLLQKEKPAHRLMAFMAANGYKNVEIAEKTRYSVAAVSNTIRQPWMQAMIQAEQRKVGVDELRETFRAGAIKG